MYIANIVYANTVAFKFASQIYHLIQAVNSQISVFCFFNELHQMIYIHFLGSVEMFGSINILFHI